MVRVDAALKWAPPARPRIPRRRDRNPLYAAADPPASGRCPTARGPSVASARPLQLLALDQEHSCWRSVAVKDLYGSTDQLVRARFESLQIERLVDDEPSAKDDQLSGH